MRQTIAALAFILLAAPAGVAADDLDGPARELLQRSGIANQLDPYPAMVRMGLEEARARSPMPDETFRALVDATDRGFNPAKMKEIVVAQFKAGLTRAEMEGALRWLNSPLGRRITKAEEESSTTEGYRRMQDWGASISKHPPSEARARQVRRIDKAGGITDFSLRSQKNSQLALVAALTATQPAEAQRAAFDRVKAAFEANAKALRQRAEQDVMLGLLYSYRDIPDDELDAYAAFMESPVGRKYMEASCDGFDEAVVRATHNFGAVVRETLKHPRSGA